MFFDTYSLLNLLFNVYLLSMLVVLVALIVKGREMFTTFFTIEKLGLIVPMVVFAPITILGHTSKWLKSKITKELVLNSLHWVFESDYKTLGVMGPVALLAFGLAVYIGAGTFWGVLLIAFGALPALITVLTLVHIGGQ